ncbi:hypothetical protein ACVDG5_003180 [Mesorhizobium sp. ORM6]
MSFDENIDLSKVSSVSTTHRACIEVRCSTKQSGNEHQDQAESQVKFKRQDKSAGGANARVAVFMASLRAGGTERAMLTLVGNLIGVG